MKQLKQWLAKKAANTKETVQEIGELASWLLLRKNPQNNNGAACGSARPAKPDFSKPKSAPSRLSAKEIMEFFSWLQARAADARLSEHERRQLHNWIAGRLERGGTVDSSTVEEIRRTIDEQSS